MEQEHYHAFVGNSSDPVGRWEDRDEAEEFVNDPKHIEWWATTEDIWTCTKDPCKITMDYFDGTDPSLVRIHGLRWVRG